MAKIQEGSTEKLRQESQPDNASTSNNSLDNESENSPSEMSQPQTPDQKQPLAPKRFVNVPLIPLKVILFCWYGAGACLLPYMTLHMKQLGLTALEQTAVYTILPIVQLFGTPLAGFFADRFRNYKAVLNLTLQVCVLTTLMIQFLVPARKSKLTSKAISYDSPDDEVENTPNPMYMATFYLYLVIRVVHQLTVGLTYVLLDTTTLVMAEENRSSYGRQRFWAIFATGIFSPLCGHIIDSISNNVDPITQKIVKNYDPAFYLFEFLTVYTLIMATTIKMKISAPPTNIWGNVKPLLSSATIWIFLFAVLIMGSCWGFLESFLFIYLEELGAGSSLMGYTVTIGAFVGLPFLYGSDWFIKKVGAVQLLILALLVYFVRLVGYSYIENPWWCVPYELMEAFTLHLMWVATVHLAYHIAPNGMLATLQAIVGGLNFGVGRGFGSFVGGTTLALYGTRIAFRVVGTMALLTAIFYAVCHYCCLIDLGKFSKNNKKQSNKRRRQTVKDMGGDCKDTSAA